MGSCTEGRLMVGLWAEELKEKGVDEEVIEALIDEDKIQGASPYYDSERSEWFIGVEIDVGSIDEVLKAAANARVVFKKVLGENLEPRIEGVADVF